MTAVLDQRMLALAGANRIRTYRAVLKQRVKRGEVNVRTLLADPPAEIDTMRVYVLLVAMPRTGAAKAARVLNTVRVAQSKTVGGLSERGASTLAGARESLAQTLERLVDDGYLYVEQRDEIEKKVRAIESAMAIRPDPTPRLAPLEIEDGFGV